MDWSDRKTKAFDQRIYDDLSSRFMALVFLRPIKISIVLESLIYDLIHWHSLVYIMDVV
jgi:hypothetical protein